MMDESERKIVEEARHMIDAVDRLTQCNGWIEGGGVWAGCILLGPHDALKDAILCNDTKND